MHAYLVFPFKFEMDNSNSIGRTSSRSYRVSATTRQNGAVSGRIFFFSRSRLQRGIVWYCTEKCVRAPLYCRHADGAQKRWKNTNKSTLIYLRKKTKLSPILYVNWLDLLSRKQHALCAEVVIKWENKLSWIVIRSISRQAMWARWSRVKFPFYSSNYLFPAGPLTTALYLFDSVLDTFFRGQKVTASLLSCSHRVDQIRSHDTLKHLFAELSRHG